MKKEENLYAGQDLVDAVVDRNYKGVEKAMKDGADLNGTPGNTALLLAVDLNFEEIVDLLVKKGVNPSAIDDLPLLTAAQKGNKNMIASLFRGISDPTGAKRQLAKEQAIYFGNNPESLNL